MMLVLYVRLSCGSLSITTPVSLLSNKFYVRSVLHGQMSLADVNQSCTFHEAMNGCKSQPHCRLVNDGPTVRIYTIDDSCTLAAAI